MKLDDGSGNGGLMTTQEDLLGATGGKAQEFENSYLLTEMDSVTNRLESPNNATSDILNTSQGTMRKRKALKSESLKQNEKVIREQELDQTTDFIEYLEFLAEYFKQLDRLDAAGRKLLHVFQDPHSPTIKLQSLRSWLLNLDLWGSYLPLNTQLYDV